MNDNDLISRSAAIDAIVFNSENKFAVDVLNDVPSVDAAPVVRCRDCEHAHRGGCMLTLEGGWNGDDWYCAEGKRREETT